MYADASKRRAIAVHCLTLDFIDTRSCRRCKFDRTAEEIDRSRGDQRLEVHKGTRIDGELMGSDEAMHRSRGVMHRSAYKKALQTVATCAGVRRQQHAMAGASSTTMCSLARVFDVGNIEKLSGTDRNIGEPGTS